MGAVKSVIPGGWDGLPLPEGLITATDFKRTRITPDFPMRPAYQTIDPAYPPPIRAANASIRATVPASA